MIYFASERNPEQKVNIYQTERRLYLVAAMLSKKRPGERFRFLPEQLALMLRDEDHPALKEAFPFSPSQHRSHQLDETIKLMNLDDRVLAYLSNNMWEIRDIDYLVRYAREELSPEDFRYFSNLGNKIKKNI